MAAPLLLRGVPLLRLRLQHRRLDVAVGLLARKPWSTVAESTRPDENVSPSFQNSAILSAKDPPNYPRWDDPAYRRWKDKEAEILSDIEPITLLTKEILHSHRYMDGEQLTTEDEKAVVEKLLAYHPHSEDKIGCGIDSIMFPNCGETIVFYIQKTSLCNVLSTVEGSLLHALKVKCLMLGFFFSPFSLHKEQLGIRDRLDWPDSHSAYCLTIAKLRLMEAAVSRANGEKSDV